MTSFLEKIEARRNATTALAHKIVLFLGEAGRSALITEAPDDIHFYDVMFSKAGALQGLAIYSANGRKAALQTKQMVETISPGASVFAVVDRDFNFDEPSGVHGGILCINVYSIENYLYSEDLILRFIESYFALSPLNEEREIVRQRVIAMFESIPASLIDIHALAVLARRHEKECLLNSVQINRLLRLQDDGTVVSIDVAIDEFCAMSRLQLAEFDHDAVVNAKAELERIEPKAWIRGHFLFDIILKCIEACRVTLDNLFRQKSYSRTRTRVALQAQSLFSILCHQLEVPHEIRELYDVVSNRMAQQEP